MRGTVFIAEDSDDDDFLIWSGRFSAHWETPDGSAFIEGPQGASLDAVIAWGRSQSDVVLLCPGDSDVFYSAGAWQPAADDDEDIRPWPEGATVERRRHAGMEHLDLVADEPIRWTVRLPKDLPADGYEVHARRVADELAARGAASRVSIEDGRRPFEAVFRFSVSARTHAEALEQVFALDSRAMRVAPPASDGRALESEEIVYLFWDFDPFDDIRPADK